MRRFSTLNLTLMIMSCTIVNLMFIFFKIFYLNKSSRSYKKVNNIHLIKVMRFLFNLLIRRVLVLI